MHKQREVVASQRGQAIAENPNKKPLTFRPNGRKIRGKFDRANEYQSYARLTGHYLPRLEFKMKTAPHIFMIPAIYVIDHVTLLTTKLANMLTPLGAPDAVVAFTHGSYRLAFALSTWAFIWHMTLPLARFMIKLLHGIIGGVEWLESAFDRLWTFCRSNLRRFFVWCAHKIGENETDLSEPADHEIH